MEWVKPDADAGSNFKADPYHLGGQIDPLINWSNIVNQHFKELGRPHIGADAGEFSKPIHTHLPTMYPSEYYGFHQLLRLSESFQTIWCPLLLI